MTLCVEVSVVAHPENTMTLSTVIDKDDSKVYVYVARLSMLSTDCEAPVCCWWG